MLRLTKPSHGNRRLIVTDSEFAFVKTGIACLDYGLDFIGLVKTATSKLSIVVSVFYCYFISIYLFYFSSSINVNQRKGENISLMYLPLRISECLLMYGVTRN